MITKRSKRADFPPVYTQLPGTIRFGFKKLDGWTEVKKLSDIPCEVVFYKFPSRTEAVRFFDGLVSHPLHSGDNTGIATVNEFVLVAYYQSDQEKKTFLEVTPLSLEK